MSERRLNVFRAYERKSEFHEDNVTRALMCLLNASPELARAFMREFVDAELTFEATDRPLVRLQLQPSGWDPRPFTRRYVLPISTTGELPLSESEEPDLQASSAQNVADRLGLDREDVTEELLEELRSSRPDAGLIWPQSGPGGIVVLIEAKTKCRQLCSQLRRHQQAFLGGDQSSRLIPPRRWTEVASFLARTSRELANTEVIGGFLIGDFLGYLNASSFGRPILPEVQVAMLRESQHFARLVNDQIPEILQLAIRKAQSASAQWGLRAGDVGKLQGSWNKWNGFYHQFWVSLRGNDWNIGLFFALGRWVGSGHAFYVIIQAPKTKKDTIDEIVEARPDWERLNEGSNDQWCVLPIEMPAEKDSLANDEFADYLLAVLKQEFEWLRSWLTRPNDPTGVPQ